MQTLLALMKNIPPDLQVFLLAMLPVIELRGAIPLAIAMGMPGWKAFTLAVLGNILPVAPLLLYLEPLARLLSAKSPVSERFFRWLFARTRRHSAQVEKYGVLGLLIFVAIPLPGTGAWTGAILAFLLGIRFWYAFGALLLGVIGAGLLVTLASLGVREVARYLVDWEIAGLLLLFGVILLYFIRQKKKISQKKS